MPSVGFGSNGSAIPDPDGGPSRRTLLSVLAAVALCPTPAFANTVNVLDFGARGDGRSEDTAAFQAALRAVAGTGGRIVVPPAPVAYVIGDGRRKGTSLRTPSGVTWAGEGALILHRARTGIGRSELFEIDNASDVTIGGFIVEAEEQVRKAVMMVGSTARIVLHDLTIRNCVNFAIACGTDGSRFEDVLMERIVIEGACGVAGTGSGINFFPRSQTGEVPASRGLVMRDIRIDVSQGRDPKKRQRGRAAGPQCIKLNNLTDAVIERCTATGAAIAGINISNGTANIAIRDTECSRNGWGMRVTARNNDTTTQTRNVTLQRCSAYANDKGALSLESGVSNTLVEDCRFAGPIVLSRSPHRRLRLADARGEGRAEWRGADGKDVAIRARRGDTVFVNDPQGRRNLRGLVDRQGRAIAVIGETDMGIIDGLTIRGGEIGGIETAGRRAPVLVGYSMEGTRIAPGGRIDLPR